MATGAALAFDAIGGGRLAGQILAGMEAAVSAGAGGYSRYGSAVHKQVYIYGALDRRPTELTRTYGMAWGIGGWLLTPFLQKVGLARVAQLKDQVAEGLNTTFASSYSGEVSLAGALSLDAIAGYSKAGDRLEIPHHPEPPRLARQAGRSQRARITLQFAAWQVIRTGGWTAGSGRCD